MTAIHPQIHRQSSQMHNNDKIIKININISPVLP